MDSSLSPGDGAAIEPSVDSLALGDTQPQRQFRSDREVGESFLQIVETKLPGAIQALKDQVTGNTSASESGETGKKRQRGKKDKTPLPPEHPPFWPAPEAEDVGKRMIQMYHEHLQADEVRIYYIFSDKTIKSKGKEEWGRLELVQGKKAYLPSLVQYLKDVERGERSVPEHHVAISLDDSPFFVVTLWWGAWKRLKPEDRMALIDHELKHAWVDVDDEGKLKFSTRDHDFVGFFDEWRRWGPWRSDLAHLDFVARTKRG